jgi:hypothetical protein
VPATPIDPAKLPHGVSQDEAKRMVSELLASGEVVWLEAPDLFELPDHIQRLVYAATAPNSVEHHEETQHFRIKRQTPREKVVEPNRVPFGAFGAMASTLARSPPRIEEKSPTHSSTEKEAWAAHLELVKYRDRCKAEQREMYIAARIYFERGVQPEAIRGRPEEWGPRSDALRYAAALKLGCTHRQALKTISRHAARIKQLAKDIPEADIALQIGLGVIGH